MRVSKFRNLCVLAAAELPVSLALGQNITILTNSVGDVGNAGDGYGAVNYQYSIGRYEVTNAQYAAFLNAKAVTDAYGLYNSSMAIRGGITRSGSSGSYAYAAVSGRENWAVNYVSFWDAARFTNWLQNGQGSGDTETGTYTLTPGAISANTVARNPGSTWAITSEDEWYKAAYYKGGSLSAGYWNYATQSDSITTAMANYEWSAGSVSAVGSYAFASAYGTFDMSGNVFEWNEAILNNLDGLYRHVRGGAWNEGEGFLSAGFRESVQPQVENGILGFRVAHIPGPGPLAALVLGGLLLRGRRRVGRRLEAVGSEEISTCNARTAPVGRWKLARLRDVQRNLHPYA